MPYKRVDKSVYTQDSKGNWNKTATASSVKNANSMIKRLRMVKQYGKKGRYFQTKKRTIS